MNNILTIAKVLIRSIGFKVFGHCYGVATAYGAVDISFGTKVYGKKGGEVCIDKGITIAKNTVVAAVKGKILIGKNCFIGRNCSIIAHESINIGDNCMFGPGVVIYDHDHIFDEMGVHNEGYATSPIVIGDRCWLGANSVILRGSVIGDGCVIGAGTVVKGVIPPHSIVTNNTSIRIRPITVRE